MRGHEPAEHRARRGDRHLLPHDRSHAELEPVDAARHAQPGARAHERRDRGIVAELRRDGHGVRVQVEQAPAARHRGGQVAEVGEAQLRPDETRLRREGDDCRPVLERQRAAVGQALDLLHPGNRPRGQECEQRLAVERLAAREAQLDRPGRSRIAAAAGARPELCGRAAVDGEQRVVELPDASEARAGGELAERQLGGLDQRARGLGALRPRERDRAGTELCRKDPVQLALREVEPRGEAANTVAVDRAIGDQPHRAPGHPGPPVPHRGSRRGVRVAALARPEALLLRGGHGPEETDVAAVRGPRRAARAAVHVCRGDTDDEEAVIARVAALHQPVAALEVVDHMTIVPRRLAVFGHAGRGLRKHR